MGQNGVGPKEIELTDVYRVEEFIQGRPLTFFELGHPMIQKQLMEMICDINHNIELNHLIRELKEPRTNFSSDFIKKPMGWFNRYYNEVRPKLLAADLASFPRVKTIFDKFEQIISDKEAFINEYEALFCNSFQRQGEELFTHNDIQENNILVWNQDKTKFTIIDFEYSSINFKGYDIASFINESYIDYSHPTFPKYKIYGDLMTSFFENGEMEKLLTFYLKKQFELENSRNPDYQFKGKLPTMLESELPILRD